eukprot:TRINITY_DN6909_c0_g1_i1.p1 TRINITY_DN6909_c0_g1~~TRINITY_DN6909_c0_g1_i1.p1  ORF type:complete len:427 (-),score=48.31 TRINITY_DN6909_c0_g1_i1:265-1545(-)
MLFDIRDVKDSTEKPAHITLPSRILLEGISYRYINEIKFMLEKLSLDYITVKVFYDILPVCWSCYQICENSELCNGCKAVWYCSEECRLVDLERNYFYNHAAQCHLFKEYLQDKEIFSNLCPSGCTESIDLPLPFCLSDLHQIGVWRYVCSCEDCLELKINQNSEWIDTDRHCIFRDINLKSSEILDMDIGLNNTGKLFSTLPDPISIKNWGDYYKIRLFPEDSPLCYLLTYPLTILHIIYNLCKETRRTIAESKQIVIDIVGVEVEAVILPYFKEIAALLPHTHIILNFIGTYLPSSLNNYSFSQGRTTAEIFLMKYQDYLANENHSLPDICIGLNAGISSYADWREMYRTLLYEAPFPCYFTNHSKASSICDINFVKHCGGNLETDCTPNPFFSPFNMAKPSTQMPNHINGYVYGFRATTINIL